MCGIVGLWRRQAADVPFAQAVQALAHRGPDGNGSYVDAASGVMLGHTRLAILDLSEAGSQPMYSEHGDVVLVFNGEIYNFRELREELVSAGVQFRGHSDTEVLLQLYLRDGHAMLPRLNGIFALAFHDRRSGELFIARDALGVKPLYYSEGDAEIAFASEVKALLPLLAQPLALDLEALQSYVTHLWCAGEGTPVKQVRKLLPGHAMTVHDGRVTRRWAWYELPARRGITGTLGEHAAIRAVHDGLRAAVHRQLVSDVPVGAFLSGGLDSSAIVAFAAEQLGEVRCFSIESAGAVDAGEIDDLPYARRVAAHLRVPLDVVRVDAAEMAANLQRMVVQLDEPLADPAALNVLYISQLARENGIKVMLSGAGGDDLFTGYRRHLALNYERAWAWLPKPARSALSTLAGRLDQRSAVGRRAQKLFAHASAGADERLAGYFAWVDAPSLQRLYSPHMREALRSVRADQAMREFLEGIPAGPSRLERMLALEQRFFLPDHNLTYTDKMSMAVGVEVRVPFLDTELVEIAARVPDSFKQRGRVGKWVLKRAMEPYLPKDVIYRPKTGFGVPLRRWMRHDLRELLGDLLSVGSLRRRGLFDPAEVHRLIADNDSGRRDGAYTLLSLLCIEIWCRAYLDAR